MVERMCDVVTVGDVAARVRNPLSIHWDLAVIAEKRGDAWEEDRWWVFVVAKE